MRLIDADAVHATILQAFSDGHDDPTGKLLGDLIDEAPTITPPPNPPLKLEELREMDGEPVWIERVGDTLHIFDRWAFVDKENCLCRTSDRSSAFFEVYGKSWFAYRRKPEEGTT